MENISIKEFYKEIFDDGETKLEDFLESKSQKDLGHFNVFDTAKFYYSGRKNRKWLTTEGYITKLV